MANTLEETKKPNRRTFLKGAASAAGGIAFAKWALTNADVAAQQGQAYVIVSDVIRGSGGAPQGPGCTETSVFKKGEQLVWRAVVYDAKTGVLLDTPKDVTDHALKMSVKPEGLDAITMNFDQHPGANRNPKPEDVIYYWTGPFIIPPNVNAGKFKYTITVEGKEGKGTLDVLGNKAVDTFPIALDIS
ncbi:twin-arginine translocation signal domain-containing protein [Candidatus Acetothermia bacterium]|nr:twin-arginine translocation signal domain-containing protein [Candidatus Acetothermia bacterium]MBI3461096.1 twin-arginine translocation signal domain-containing protein [Candidatus Acetothermia bacterium]